MGGFYSSCREGGIFLSYGKKERQDFKWVIFIFNFTELYEVHTPWSSKSCRNLYMNAAAFPRLPSVKHDGDFTWPSLIVTQTRLHCIIQLSSHVCGIFFHLLYCNFQSKTFTFTMKHSSVFLWQQSVCFCYWYLYKQVIYVRILCHKTKLVQQQVLYVKDYMETE